MRLVLIQSQTFLPQMGHRLTQIRKGYLKDLECVYYEIVLAFICDNLCPICGKNVFVSIPKNQAEKSAPSRTGMLTPLGVGGAAA